MPNLETLAELMRNSERDGIEYIKEKITELLVELGHDNQTYNDQELTEKLAEWNSNFSEIAAEPYPTDIKAKKLTDLYNMIGDNVNEISKRIGKNKRK